jgi:hypothetical protein
MWKELYITEYKQEHNRTGKEIFISPRGSGREEAPDGTIFYFFFY